jgi:UTP:GlnB (protein PII) uridylyltransferase
MSSNIRGTWVQTERKAHEGWAKLIRSSPKAAELLHVLVANMDKKAAVVVSQKVLAEMMGTSVPTVKRAVTVLQDGNWVDIVRIGSERGGVNAYVVNRRVAWADNRDNQKYAIFDARIITSASEQDRDTSVLQEPLNQLPNFGEFQIPIGDGLPPPNQPSFDGLEPDLPVINDKDEPESLKLERLGQARLL